MNTREDRDMTTAKGFVAPTGGGKRLDSPAPGRFFDLKLLGHETGESIMMFEETLPAGTASLHHLHRDSDEVAWVLAGEITFKIGDEVTSGGPGTCAFMPRDIPHAWKVTGSETARALFLYTPAAAGGYIEALTERRNNRRRTQQTLRAPSLGSRRPQPALRPYVASKRLPRPLVYHIPEACPRPVRAPAPFSICRGWTPAPVAATSPMPR
jgi:quercetin dioxygenase-like cupin family protein